MRRATAPTTAGWPRRTTHRSARRPPTTTWCPGSRRSSCARGAISSASTMRRKGWPSCPRSSGTNNSRGSPVPDIHITREHALGFPAARKLAFRWAEEAEERLGMECVYEEGKASDLVTFTRLGANGELKVMKDRFELDARLGVLLGAFRDKIETEIV